MTSRRRTRRAHSARGRGLKGYDFGSRRQAPLGDPFTPPPAARGNDGRLGAPATMPGARCGPPMCVRDGRGHGRCHRRAPADRSAQLRQGQSPTVGRAERRPGASEQPWPACRRRRMPPHAAHRENAPPPRRHPARLPPAERTGKAGRRAAYRPAPILTRAIASRAPLHGQASCVSAKPLDFMPTALRDGRLDSGPRR